MIYYITFYSYKGGVGRTLALVNTAYSFAARGKRTLIWDLDLEAPSLLRFPQFDELRGRVSGGTMDALLAPEADLDRQVARYVLPAGPNVSVLPAAPDDDKYPERYAELAERFFGPNVEEASRRFEQVRHAIEALPAGTRPEIVLIDSRTGLTDLGAICTVQLPHAVVLVYTMNQQGAFGAKRMLRNIVSASERLRPHQPVSTVLVAGFVPTEDVQLVDRRRAQLAEMGLKPDFEIPFRRALLLREEVYAGNDLDPELARVFARLADRLVEMGPAGEEPVRLSLERFPESPHERGRKFEDKVAGALQLMDLEVTQNVMVSGRQIDAVAHGKAGLQPIDYVVECKDRKKPAGVDDIDSLHARVDAFRKAEGKPSAQGLLVSAAGFTAEARAHARDLQTVLLKTYDELLDELVNLGPYNATLIQDVAGQPIERLYVEQDVYPEEKPQPVALFEHVDRWLNDPESTFLGLLGDYGTGKTWFTRMLAFRLAQAAREDSGRRRQPVRIDLRSVAKAIDLESILFTHFQGTTGRNVSPKAFLRLLEEGRYLLILDGFDEMATQGDWSVTLENFRQIARATAGQAKVLLTCRTHYFREQSYVEELIAGRSPDLGERATELYREISGRRGYRLAYLRGFTDEQAGQFIERSCGERAPEVRRILEREPSLREIANRPILLEIIVKSAPKLVGLGTEIQVADLYQAYTEDWFVREDWRLRMTHDRRRELVEALAARLWREPSARLHHSELRQIIEPLLSGRAFTVRNLEDADREIRTAAFLTRDALGYYGFSHRSFLEFFLASWIRRRLEAGEFVEALRHPPLTPPVLRFLEELTGIESRDRAVRATLEAPYAAEASENALLLYSRRKGPALRGAQLAGAKLAGFRLAGLDLNRADLTRADLPEADLSGADLNGAVLREANMERANLERASAAGAIFAGANLQGGALEEACLEKADFSSADLRFASLLGARAAGAVWNEARDAGMARPERPRQGLAPLGWLPRIDPQAIAMHPRLPLIAVADGGGIWIVDSVRGLLRRHLPHPNAKSVAWDAEGRRLASGSGDKTVRVWDAAAGQLLRTLEGHTDWVSSVAWDAEGRRLASGSDDKTVRVWDAAAGQLLRTLEGHTDWVSSVAWDAEGRRLASGSDDHTVRVWDAAAGQLLRTLEGHTAGVRSVAWDAEGRRLASGSDDKTVRVWDAAAGQLLRTLEGHTAWVSSVAWDAEGRRLASGSGDKTVRVWDAAAGQLLRTLEGHTAWVSSVAWDAEGRRLASGSGDKTVRVWDAAAGQLLRTLEGHTDWVSSVAWDAEGRRLASGSDDKTVRVWDAAAGQLLRTLEGHTAWVSSVAWDAEGRRLASGSGDKTVRVWDAAAGQLLRTLEGHTDWVSSVAWDAEGRRLASGSDDKTVRVWDAAAGQLLRTLEGHTAWVSSVAWDAEGRRLASGSGDKTVRVWDAAAGQLLRTLEGHTAGVRSVAWDAEGRRLASGSDDKTVRVWDAAAGQLLRTLEGHTAWVSSVAWDAEGRRLASGSRDNTVRVWDAAKGRLLRTLEGHRGAVQSVVWDSQGRIASASGDSSIRIWDAETGRCLWTYYFLPEGGWLALRHDGKFRANEAGKRNFMFAHEWALYPARAFPELDLDV